MKFLVAAGISLLSSLFACQKLNESTLNQNAVPNDANTTLIKVIDGPITFPLLITKDKGYKLECNNPVKLSQLIIGLGYPPAAAPFMTAKNIDDPMVIDSTTPVPKLLTALASIRGITVEVINLLPPIVM